MAQSKTRLKRRAKIIGYAVGALVGGIVLLILSQSTKSAKTTTPPTPVSTSAPAPGPDSPDVPARDRDEAAAQSMSGILLLFSMGAFLLFVICTGWLVIDIRNARPAWKTQKKYPKRHKH